jgi:hypothetical protein
MGLKVDCNHWFEACPSMTMRTPRSTMCTHTFQFQRIISNSINNRPLFLDQAQDLFSHQLSPTLLTPASILIPTEQRCINLPPLQHLFPRRARWAPPCVGISATLQRSHASEPSVQASPSHKSLRQLHPTFSLAIVRTAYAKPLSS